MVHRVDVLKDILQSRNFRLHRTVLVELSGFCPLIAVQFLELSVTSGISFLPVYTYKPKFGRSGGMKSWNSGGERVLANLDARLPESPCFSAGGFKDSGAADFSARFASSLASNWMRFVRFFICSKLVKGFHDKLFE